jgi:hypothetical protein
MAAQSAANAQAAAPISTADLMKPLQSYRAPTKQATTIHEPRAGEVNNVGAWTGSGSGPSETAILRFGPILCGPSQNKSLVEYRLSQPRPKI